jgi:hypothetical protein
LLGAGLQQDRLHRGRLSTCLAHLNQLAAEIQLHATAVRLGRLATSNQLIAVQRGSSGLANSRLGSSFREGKMAPPENRLMKYRGSKTDTCLTGSGRGGAQRPIMVDRQGRRKSSVIEQLSSFLKTGLKL